MKSVFCLVLLLTSTLAQAQGPQADNFESFYRVVLQLENATQTEAGYIQYYDRVVKFVESIQSKVMNEIDLTTRLKLAEEAHNIGYWQAEKLKVNSRSRLELGATLPEKAVGLLTLAGQNAYDNRYENFISGKNKLTAQTLDILSLDYAERRAFFDAVGKTELSAAQIAELTDKTVLMNLYHMEFNQMVETGKKIVNDAAKAAFLNQIVKNQIAAIARTVIVSSFANSHDLSHAIQVPGELAYTQEDLITFLLWKFTGHYDGKEGFAKLPDLVAKGYAQIPADIRLLDKTMNDAIRKTVDSDVITKVITAVNTSVDPCDTGYSTP